MITNTGFRLTGDAEVMGSKFRNGFPLELVTLVFHMYFWGKTKEVSDD